MAELEIKVEISAFKIAGAALAEQVGRLAKLLEDLPPDHWARQFELPLSDLFTALQDADMLAVTEKRDGFAIFPHPALVNYGGLIAAICDGIAAKLAAEGGAA